MISDEFEEGNREYFFFLFRAGARVCVLVVVLLLYYTLLMYSFWWVFLPRILRRVATTGNDALRRCV